MLTFFFSIYGFLLRINPDYIISYTYDDYTRNVDIFNMQDINDNTQINNDNSQINNISNTSNNLYNINSVSNLMR